jgi:2,3-bisphosphoglycerate-independent phosphoglycerate mutase
MLASRAILIILDGWGHGPDPAVSAIAQADTPVMDSLYKKYPNSELITYGEDVGLPDGQMGNSEVGHLNIGAGRVVYQELARINKAIRDKDLHQNKVLLDALASAKAENRRVHLMGLVSDGGVHSHIDHLKALCDICDEQGLSEVFIHAFTDGRDTDPKSGKGFIAELLDHINGKSAKLASVIGRYFAMDRDKRWERVKKAYDLLVRAKGEPVRDPLAAIQAQYEQGVTDEFLEPVLCVNEDREAVAKIEEGDCVLCFNFRTDRPRQITRVLTQEDMPAFDMHKLALQYVSMTRYDETFKGIPVLFEKEDVQETLGELLSKLGKKQIRIAETEKYPHVTFFFNGGREEPFEGESRILIPSPKVATYDLQPEMSAPGITQAIIAAMREQQPDFICLNYANTDMVGHTGVFEAAVSAAETVDACLGELLEAAGEKGYAAVIIADHGNSDFMINADGSPNTAHTKNPVPCILVSDSSEPLSLAEGRLADVAPTLLDIMGIPQPEAMTGHSLIKK